MPTLVDLLESALRLPVEIAKIATQDPFNLVLVGVGSLILAGASGMFGYVVLGAVADLVGIDLPTLGRGQRDAEGRIPTARPNPNYEDEAAGGAARAKREE